MPQGRQRSRTVRRYGPSQVAPEVQPRPQLGRGREQAFQAFSAMFETANNFIRPAVEQERQIIGEREALESVREDGPEFGLEEIPRQERPPRPRGQGAAEAALSGQQGGRPRPRPSGDPEAPQPQGDRRVPDMFDTSPDKFGGSVMPDRTRTDVYGQKTGRGEVYTDRPNPVAMQLIRDKEGFRTDPYWDVNALRVGYGSDTVTRPDGSVQRVDRNTRVSREDAERDLERRITEEFQADAIRAAGNRWAEFTPEQQAALTSVAYNYGSIPDRLRKTLRSGSTEEIANGIEALGSDNEGVNRSRRQEEAELFRGGPGAPDLGDIPRPPETPEHRLEVLNENSFEPRRPFTVRDQAFNSAADRVIQARANEALESGVTAAMQRADGDIGKLRQEMEQVRKTVMGQLPRDLPGLELELQERFERASGVAERNAVELQQKRVMRQQEAAQAQAISSIQQEAERVALTGGSAEDLASAMTQGQEALVQYGPREEFTVNGQTYPADPSRAGMMTPGDIEVQSREIAQRANRIMLESEFARSEAPGAFVDEFRREVFSGNSPLPPGQALDLLRQLEGRARQAESHRRTEANRERQRLEEEMGETINAYVHMTEAGAPVAIPQAERDRILSALSPYPDSQRQAELEFAVADAMVETHGMSGPELLEYVGRVREDMQGAVERGELDMEGVAVIQALQDRVKKVQDGVSAEMLGLPMIEQMVRDGADHGSVDYDALRAQAADKPELVQRINEIEAFHLEAENLQGKSASERDAILEEGRGHLAGLAAEGEFAGVQGAFSGRVMDRLEEWSQHRAELAESDPMRFGRAVGVDLPSFDGIEGLADAGRVVADRVRALAPHTEDEGVRHPVPLQQDEIDLLGEAYDGAPRQQRMQFLQQITDLGREQAERIFGRMQGTHPQMFAAGHVYSQGNRQAASTIMRGSADVNVGGDAAIDLQAARSAALGNLAEADILTPDSYETLDDVAVAYARGKAIADGLREINVRDLEDGYAIALGRQEDGTGGPQRTRYGHTIAPPGYTGREISQLIGRIDDAAMTQIAGGQVVDGSGRWFTAPELTRSIEALVPSPDDPEVLVPLDAEGGFFGVERSAAEHEGSPLDQFGVFSISLPELRKMQEDR